MVTYEIVKGEEEKEEAEKVLKVRLIVEDEDLKLESLDKDGNHEWYLLRITSDGVLHRNRNIGKETGLKLDCAGRITLGDDY